jgi:hypothetical protein
VLALLAALACALYLLTWLVEGPPTRREAPAVIPAPPIAPATVALAKAPV